MEQNSQAIARQAASKLGVAYLSLPLLLFFLTWFKLLVGVPMAILLAFALRDTVNIGKRELQALAAHWAEILLCIFSAAAIMLSCGGSPLLHTLWPLDMQKHASIAHDLYSFQWPVAYFSIDGATTILRYALGYYLVPGLLSKFIGYSSFKWLLCGWATIGLALYLIIVTTWAKTFAWSIVFVAASLFWGGLNIVGAALIGELSNAGATYTTWMYSQHNWLIGSNIFSAAFSPQHAIAAWILAAVICACRRDAWFRKASGISILSVAFWSPFVAIIGAVLWGSVLTLDIKKAGTRDLLKFSVITPTVIIAAVLALYLGAESASIPFSIRPPSSYVDYLLFVAVEFLLVFLVASWALRRAEPVLCVSVLLLAILPFVMGGVAGDLMMRGSIPLTTVLALYSMRALQDSRGSTRYVLSVLIIAGSACSALELRREIISPAVNVVAEPIFMFRYPLNPQYIAQIDDHSPLHALLADRERAYYAESISIQTKPWAHDGEASFNISELTVSSTTPTIAFLSTPLDLQPGLYKVALVLDWNLRFVNPKDTEGRSSNIEVAVNQVPLLGIDRWMYKGGKPDYSLAVKRRATVFFRIAPGNKPPLLSFGLGGDGYVGAGTIRLEDVSFQKLTPSAVQ